jgi:hypothetical protein
MYKIILMLPRTYLDKMSQPVNGYEVRFEITKTGEQHIIMVPKMDASLIDSEIKRFIQEREKLDSLGKG